MSSREFVGEEFYKLCQQDHDRIRHWLKTLGGKPDQYVKVMLPIEKAFLSFYKGVL